MSKNADTFALYANVHIISSPCSAFGFSYCPAHLNFLIKSFKEITFFFQTLPSPLPAAKTKQNAETFNIFLRRPFKIRKYSRLPRPPRRGGGADPLKRDAKEIIKKTEPKDFGRLARRPYVFIHARYYSRRPSQEKP